MPAEECPVFHPTVEEFSRPFCDYVSGVFRDNPDLPCFRVKPPDGWKPRQAPYPDMSTISIRTPIRQHAFGKSGAYRCLLVEENGLSVADFQVQAKTEGMRRERGASDDGVPQDRAEVDMDRCERSFWASVTMNPPMYGADTPVSFFEGVPYGWDFNNLGDLLSQKDVPEIPGVTSPMCYFGMWRSFFGWHKEDADLLSINYLHFGAPKVWYCVSPKHADKFERMATHLFPELAQQCGAFIRHKDLLISPSQLHNFGIPYMLARHEAGEFMVLNACAYHAGFNTGFNCAEAINFATEDWVKVGKAANHCTCSALRDGVRISMTLFDPSWRDPWASSESGDEPDGEDPSSECQSDHTNARHGEQYAITRAQLLSSWVTDGSRQKRGTDEQLPAAKRLAGIGRRHVGMWHTAYELSEKERAASVPAAAAAATTPPAQTPAAVVEAAAAAATSTSTSDPLDSPCKPGTSEAALLVLRQRYAEMRRSRKSPEKSDDPPGRSPEKCDDPPSLPAAAREPQQPPLPSPQPPRRLPNSRIQFQPPSSKPQQQLRISQAQIYQANSRAQMQLQQQQQQQLFSRPTTQLPTRAAPTPGRMVTTIKKREPPSTIHDSLPNDMRHLLPGTQGTGFSAGTRVTTILIKQDTSLPCDARQMGFIGHTQHMGVPRLPAAAIQPLQRPRSSTSGMQLQPQLVLAPLPQAMNISSSMQHLQGPRSTPGSVHALQGPRAITSSMPFLQRAPPSHAGVRLAPDLGVGGGNALEVLQHLQRDPVQGPPCAIVGENSLGSRSFYLVQQLRRPAMSPDQVLLRLLREGPDGLFYPTTTIWEESKSALIQVRTQLMTLTEMGTPRSDCLPAWKLLTLRSRILDTDLLD